MDTNGNPFDIHEVVSTIFCRQFLTLISFYFLHKIQDSADQDLYLFPLILTSQFSLVNFEPLGHSVFEQADQASQLLLRR